MDTIDILELEDFVRSFSDLQLSGDTDMKLSEDGLLTLCLTSDLTQEFYDDLSHFDGAMP